MGLFRTAHVCEDNQTLSEGPPSHVINCRHALGCDRLDHGYNMLADPELARQCGQRGRDLVEQQRGALARLLRCIDTLR